VYRTSDSQWVCLSASTQNMTERLFRAIGRPELIVDPRFASNASRLKNVTELDEVLSAFIGERTQKNCLEFFAQAGVTVGPVYDMADIESDPHFHARQIVVELLDASLGTVPVHNISPRLMDTPGRFRCAAPELGEHTREILQEAGYSEAEIEELIAAGVVCPAPQPPRDEA
jgi:crotonobetainyl-CoA:carnitine CoA-transferase CaiB-like acyl-CoA transferase